MGSDRSRRTCGCFSQISAIPPVPLMDRFLVHEWESRNSSPSFSPNTRPARTESSTKPRPQTQKRPSDLTSRWANPSTTIYLSFTDDCSLSTVPVQCKEGSLLPPNTRQIVYLNKAYKKPPKYSANTRPLSQVMCHPSNTTLEVFTRVGPDNSLERLTERSVGLVTDRPGDVYELFVTLFE